MSKLARNSTVDDLPRNSAPQIAAGEVVRTGENLHPHYRVITLCGDRAWLRDVQIGSDHIVPLARLHRV